MTMYEFSVHLAMRRAMLEREHLTYRVLAYNVASLMRSKKLPEWKRFVQPPAKPLTRKRIDRYNQEFDDLKERMMPGSRDLRKSRTKN